MQCGAVGAEASVGGKARKPGESYDVIWADGAAGLDRPGRCPTTGSREPRAGVAARGRLSGRGIVTSKDFSGKSIAALAVSCAARRLQGWGLVGRRAYCGQAARRRRLKL
jgi:hypothetical protein